MIYTSYYTNPVIPALIAGGKTLPIRISWGSPRFRLSYKIREAAPEIMPERDMRHLDPVGYEYHYREILEEETVSKIADRLTLLSRGDFYDLVLLCFCKPGLPCHRLIFAKWWAERTGKIIKEL
jgi:hypothetical protein